MPEFKVKNTNTGNEYYYQTDVVQVKRPEPQDAEIITDLNGTRTHRFEDGIFRVEIEGVWTVPSGRSHPTTTPKSAEDIWALALTEAANDRAVEVYPTITATQNGSAAQTSTSGQTISAGSTTMQVDDGGANKTIDAPDDAVVEFANHDSRYIIQNGFTGQSGTIEIADPGFTTSIGDNVDITLYEGLPLSVLPTPGGGPEQKRTEKGADRLTRSLTFESARTFDSKDHIWDTLSDLTDAL